MGFAVFEQQPTSAAVRAFLGRAVGKADAKPKTLITDQGIQFTDGNFRKWCRRRGIFQRFGAVGKYGSIAVVERLIRTIKSECTRKLLVPYRRDDFRRELFFFVIWYNRHRPHEVLDGCTPRSTTVWNLLALRPASNHENDGLAVLLAQHRGLEFDVAVSLESNSACAAWRVAGTCRLSG